jgi:hypothetical protein
MASSAVPTWVFNVRCTERVVGLGYRVCPGVSRTADRCATCQRYVCVGCAPPLLRAAVADESRAARVS